MPGRIFPALVLDRKAGDLVPLEQFAGCLGAIVIEAGEPGAEERGIAFDDAFGEWLGAGEHRLGDSPRLAEPLLRLVLAWECADLNDPLATTYIDAWRCG